MSEHHPFLSPLGPFPASQPWGCWNVCCSHISHLEVIKGRSLAPARPCLDHALPPFLPHGAANFAPHSGHIFHRAAIVYLHVHPPARLRTLQGPRPSLMGPIGSFRPSSSGIALKVPPCPESQQEPHPVRVGWWDGLRGWGQGPG